MPRGYYDPGSWLDRLVGSCVAVFMGALTLYLAARLLLAVWVVLVVAGGVMLALLVALAWWRGRSRGW